MTTLSTPRKFLSTYVETFYDMPNKEFSFAPVTVTHGSTKVFDPIGMPVIWNGTNFIFYTNTTLISDLTTDSTLPDGAYVGIVVGSSMGAGINDVDVSVGTGGTTLYVMFRGPGAVKTDKIDWAVTDTSGASAVTAALTTQQGKFIKQLEKQGLAAVTSATTVVPVYL
jgi:hypothetical protein